MLVQIDRKRRKGCCLGMEYGHAHYLSCESMPTPDFYEGCKAEEPKCDIEPCPEYVAESDESKTCECYCTLFDHRIFTVEDVEINYSNIDGNANDTFLESVSFTKDGYETSMEWFFDDIVRIAIDGIQVYPPKES